jgi:hypothetical protein
MTLFVPGYFRRSEPRRSRKTQRPRIGTGTKAAEQLMFGLDIADIVIVIIDPFSAVIGD